MTLRDEILMLRSEVNCRIEHGANSGGHLEFVQSQLNRLLVDYPEPEGPTVTRERAMTDLSDALIDWRDAGGDVDDVALAVEALVETLRPL